MPSERNIARIGAICPRVSTRTSGGGWPTAVQRRRDLVGRAAQILLLDVRRHAQIALHRCPVVFAGHETLVHLGHIPQHQVQARITSNSGIVSACAGEFMRCVGTSTCTW